MTPEQRRERGDKARQLLGSDAFRAAAEAVSADLKDRIFRTEAEDVQRREVLHAEYRGFTALMKRLKGWADDGLMAEAEIERQRS